MALLDWNRDKSKILSRASGPSGLKLCAKVLDEPLLLAGWIEHHARIVGYENLIIADNCSTDPETLHIYESFRSKVLIFTFDGAHNQIHWHPKFSDLFSTLRGSCSYFSFVDVDERLVYLDERSWKSDATIVEHLRRFRPKGIVPTTWLINEFEDFDTFSCLDTEDRPAFVHGLKWGKPVLPSRLIGSQPGIHNAQYDQYEFCTDFGVRLFLLHLTQFPERRLSTNRNKLVSRGVVPPGTSAQDILNMSFDQLDDKSFMPLVDEMRRMNAILKGEKSMEAPRSGRLTFLPDGTFRAPDPTTQLLLTDYLKRGKDLICEHLGTHDREGSTLTEPAALLEQAISLRSGSRLWRAERLLRLGAVTHPSYPGIHGGPAFRKELMRMFLSEGQWAQAEELIPAEDDPFGIHWHLILFARASKQHGNAEGADSYWRRVLEHQPDNGEARSHFRTRSLATLRDHDARDPVLAGFLADFVTVRETLNQSRINVHHFMAQFFKHKGITPDTAFQLLSSMLDGAERVTKESGERRAKTKIVRTRIPKIVHRVWLTNPENPAEPPREYVDRLTSEASDYAARGWQLILWVTDPALIPATTQRLREAGDCIRIETVDDTTCGSGWRVLYRAFLFDRKFPFAADVLRIKLLHDHGGFYCDMGVRFAHPSVADFIADTFDYALIYWNTMFFQNSLLAMPPGNPITSAFLRICEDPYVIPEEMISPVSGITEGMAFSGLMVTAVLLSLYHADMRVCPLQPNGNLISWSSQKSWYTKSAGEGKLGNAYVPESKPSFFTGPWPASHEEFAVYHEVFSPIGLS